MGLLSEQKHRWTVPRLSELYPKGDVGTDVCLMGLNKNKGQEILLRVRTDDLQGFRKYLRCVAPTATAPPPVACLFTPVCSCLRCVVSIKEVLWHELAHNVYSEHDNDFKAFMSQLRREGNAMDWTKSRGHAVGGHDVCVRACLRQPCTVCEPRELCPNTRMLTTPGLVFCIRSTLVFVLTQVCGGGDWPTYRAGVRGRRARAGRRRC